MGLWAPTELLYGMQCHVCSDRQQKSALKTVGDRSDFPMVRNMKTWHITEDEFFHSWRTEQGEWFSFLVCLAYRAQCSCINGSIVSLRLLQPWHCLLFGEVIEQPWYQTSTSSSFMHFYQYSSEDITYCVLLLLLSSFNKSSPESFHSPFFFLEIAREVFAFVHSMY